MFGRALKNSIEIGFLKWSFLGQTCQCKIEKVSKDTSMQVAKKFTPENSISKAETFNKKNCTKKKKKSIYKVGDKRSRISGTTLHFHDQKNGQIFPCGTYLHTLMWWQLRNFISSHVKFSRCVSTVLAPLPAALNF